MISGYRRHARRAFVLPASAKTFVKGDHGQELIAFGLRQSEFGRKELLLGLENLVIAGLAGNVSLGGELDGCFQCGDLPSSLLANVGEPVA